MATYNLENIRTLLSSTKIRDRNEGLSQIENLNFDSANLVQKFGSPATYFGLLEALNFAMSHDLTIYGSNANLTNYSHSSTSVSLKHKATLNSVEARLFRSSSMFKTLIVKMLYLYNERLKLSYVSNLITFIMDNCARYEYQGGVSQMKLIEPTCFSLLTCLHEVSSIQGLKDHMKNSEYHKIINFILKALDSLTKSDTKSYDNREGGMKLITLLLETYNQFYLNPKYTSSLIILQDQSYSNHLLNIFINFKINIMNNSYNRELACLPSIFAILNKSLVLLSSINVKLCHKVYLIGTRIIIDVSSISIKELKREVYVFLNLIPDFINAFKIPKLSGDNWNFDLNGLLITSTEKTPSSKDREESVFSVSSDNSDDTQDDDTSMLFWDNMDVVDDGGDHTTNNLMTRLTKNEILQIKELRFLIDKFLEKLTNPSDLENLNLTPGQINIDVFHANDDHDYNTQLKLRFFRPSNIDDDLEKWLLRVAIPKLIDSYYDLVTSLAAQRIVPWREETDDSQPAITEEFILNATSGQSFRRDISSNKRRKVLEYDNEATDELSSKLLKKSRSLFQFIIALTSYNSTLRSSASATTTNSMSSGKLKRIQVGLQLLCFKIGASSAQTELKSSNAFVTSMIQNLNGMFEHLLNLFELQSEAINYWTLLCLYATLSLLYQIDEYRSLEGMQLKTAVVAKLLKYSFEMVRSEQLTKPASSLLSVALKAICDNHSGIINSQQLDRTTMAQFESLIDLAQINGPALLCKESVMFWFSSYKVCKIFTFNTVKLFNSSRTSNQQQLADAVNLSNNTLFSSKVTFWLFSKWAQMRELQNQDDIYLISKLICWLLGLSNLHLKNFSEAKNDSNSPSTATVLQLFELWNENSRVRNYTLLSNYDGERPILFKNRVLVDLEVLSTEQLLKNKLLLELVTELKTIVNLSGLQIILKWLICFDPLPEDNMSQNNEFEELSQICRSMVDRIILKINSLGDVDDQSLDVELRNIIGCLKVLNLTKTNLLKTKEYARLDERKIIFLLSAGPGEENGLLRLGKSGHETSKNASYEFLQNLHIQIVANFWVNYSFLTSQPDFWEHTFSSIIRLLRACDTPTKKLIFLDEVLRFVVKENYRDILKTDLEELTGTLITLLDFYDFQVYESLLTTILKFLKWFCPVWLNKYGESIGVDCVDMIAYITNLQKSDLMHSTEVYRELASLQLTILVNLKTPSELLEKADVLSSCMITLSQVDYCTILAIVDQIKDVLETEDSEYTYKKFINLFKEPQKSIESSSTFNQFCSRLSNSLLYLPLSNILTLLKFVDHPHFKKYLKYSIEESSIYHGYSSCRVLFERNRENILYYWLVDTERPISSFPYQLFGYTKYYEFLSLNYPEITSISFSFMKNSKTVIESICLILKRSTKQTVLDSLFISLPFFYCHLIPDNLVNICMEYDISVSELKSYSESHRPLVLLSLIRFCDTSDEIKTANAIDWNMGKNHFLDSNKIFTGSYYLKIQPDQLLKTFRKLFNLPKSKKMAVPCDMFYYLSSRLIHILEEESVSPAEKLLTIRKIKFLVLISDDTFSLRQTLVLHVASMSKYLSTSLLAADASHIILEALTRHEMYYKRSTSMPPEVKEYLYVLWSLLTFELVTMKRDSHVMDLFSPLIEYLQKSGENCGIENVGAISQIGLEYVNCRMLNLSLDSVIFWFNHFLEEEREGSLEHIRLISLLFELRDTPETEVIPSQYLTPKMAKYLFCLRGHPDCLGKGLASFISRFIGEYYSNTGETCPDTDSKYQVRFEDYKDGLSAKVSTLDTAFKSILQGNLEYRPKITTLNCTNSLIGAIIYKKMHLNKEESLSEFRGVVSYDIFSKYEQYILPLDLHTCSILNSQSCDVSMLYFEGSVGDFVSELNNLLEENDEQILITKFFLAIINDLQQKSFILSLLASFIPNDPTFVRRLLPHMVLYYIHSTNVKGNMHIANIISKFFSLEPSAHSKELIVLFLEIVQSIRVASLQLSKKYEGVYEKLDTIKISKSAYYADCPKTGLLLFEEYHANKATFEPTQWHKESDFLYKLYCDIDVDDLIFGLPVHPVLSHGLDAMNNQGHHTTTAFNTASLNVALSTGIVADKNTYDAVGNCMTNGEIGAAKALIEFRNSLGIEVKTSEASDIDTLYEISWKLNEWRLPSTIHMDTENKVIYRTLNNMRQIGEREYTRTFEVSSKRKEFDQIYSSLFVDYNKFENFKRKTEKIKSWFRTLSVVRNIEEISVLNDENFERKISRYFERTSNWYGAVDLDLYENICLARKASLEISHICNLNLASTRYLLAIAELDQFAVLAGQNKQYQKQVNAAVYINSLAEDLKKFETIDYHTAKKIAKFNLASAMWNQKDQTDLSVSLLNSILEDDKRMISLNKQNVPIQLPTHYINATIAKWSAESSQMTTEQIMELYIKPTVQNMQLQQTKTSKDSDTYFMFAEFCDNQIRSGDFDKTQSSLKQSLRQKQKEMSELAAYAKNSSNSKDDRKNASRVYRRLDVSYKRDVEELKVCLTNKSSCVEQAMLHYLMTLCIDESHDDISIDRFCALWMEFTDAQLDSNVLLQVPSFKFIPWVRQLMSRLSNEKTPFQKRLLELLTELCCSHPYHSMYVLYSLRHAEKDGDPVSLGRSVAASRLWNAVSNLYSNRFGNSSDVVSKISWFCDISVDLANEKINRTKEKIYFKSLRNGSQWTTMVANSGIVIPTFSVPIDKTCKYNNPQLVTIQSVNSYLAVATSGISAPKILKMTLSNGQNHKVLFKGGGDDLRQDAIMEQVFEKVNILLSRNQEIKSRNFKMRTYKVIPLTPRSGIIEFVTGTIALDKILNEIHSNDELSANQARAMMKQVQTKSTYERLLVYQKITAKIHPIMHKFFLINFFSPQLWLDNRINYSRGMAVASMVGHMLGLGDRHNNNILLDFHTCEPIHIDFGIAFDQGKALPIPELVPFRLTRDIVDGLGVTGVNGVFSKSCEMVFQVLRENSQYISGILDVLRYDPLYSWTLSPLRRKRLQEDIGVLEDNENDNDFPIAGANSDLDVDPNLELLGKNSDFGKGGTGEESEALIAIRGVLSKLEAKNLSSEAVVRELIREAVDEKNLALIFLGWCPFY